MYRPYFFPPYPAFPWNFLILTWRRSAPDQRKEKLELTGSGFDGSGGVKAGRVREKVIKGKGHLIAMDATGECAESAATWFGQEVKVFKQERKEWEEWTKKSMAEKTTLSEEWKKQIGGPIRAKGKL
jgi:hypothetical protein